MPSVSSNDTPLLPLFSSPRLAPAPNGPASVRSHHSSPPPEGFVVPQIPPPNCPFRVTRDTHGHRRLPLVSENPLPVDHEHVMKLIKYRVDVVAKCANCAELAVDCDFSEAGIPCPPCAILGIPDCNYADPYFFVANLAHRRDMYLHDERTVLCAAVRDNYLAPSQFGTSPCLPVFPHSADLLLEREYERASAWFYSAAQGAITRFLVNCHATGGLALRGYQCLAESSTDAALLSRFLTLGHDAHIHPSVLQVVADRLQSMFLSLLG
ncbi:hypothetical protein B0H13DRAFT_1855439 [Mycena leptocephala]|nr:hypothetical protein B0H13DRAFT_1855439 [Mycena leptocephala]